MKTVICVGGDGKRMGGILKPLLFKDGKTILEHIIDNLLNQGIDKDDIIFLINDKKIFTKLGFHTSDNFKGIKKFLEDDEDFLLLVGDSIINFNINDMYRFHKLNSKIPTVLLKDYKIEYGVIEDNKWIEKPIKQIVVGAFIFNRKHIINEFNIPKMVGKKFNQYKTKNNFIHLTRMEDYKKWQEERRKRFPEKIWSLS